MTHNGSGSTTPEFLELRVQIPNDGNAWEINLGTVEVYTHVRYPGRMSTPFSAEVPAVSRPLRPVPADSGNHQHRIRVLAPCYFFPITTPLPPRPNRSPPAPLPPNQPLPALAVPQAPPSTSPTENLEAWLENELESSAGTESAKSTATMTRTRHVDLEERSERAKQQLDAAGADDSPFGSGIPLISPAPKRSLLKKMSSFDVKNAVKGKNPFKKEEQKPNFKAIVSPQGARDEVGDHERQQLAKMAAIREEEAPRRAQGQASAQIGYGTVPNTAGTPLSRARPAPVKTAGAGAKDQAAVPDPDPDRSPITMTDAEADSAVWHDVLRMKLPPGGHPCRAGYEENVDEKTGYCRCKLRADYFHKKDRQIYHGVLEAKQYGALSLDFNVDIPPNPIMPRFAKFIDGITYCRTKKAHYIRVFYNQDGPEEHEFRIITDDYGKVLWLLMDLVQYVTFVRKYGEP
ncbi:hypothetical protein M501DRAFT_1055141 [Patellaria atrata CBS 101060]|uniref:Uncharacterized protein n=1 Tax=Patellaria atrata CBS 101060 TaxID=1346257 RepID=A0A9P4VR05_9PEZI|nr:hypothetical protein M501DRAFT_1055141 [Patellaria atrata CBS 101060]